MSVGPSYLLRVLAYRTEWKTDQAQRKLSGRLGNLPPSAECFQLRPADNVSRKATTNTGSRANIGLQMFKASLWLALKLNIEHRKRCVTIFPDPVSRP